MAARKIKFCTGEFYHVYNRGVDKRDIFLNQRDLERFLQCLQEFNNIKPIGSIYENSFRAADKNITPLVKLICYALNPNHFHLLLQQAAEHGVKKFMHRLGTGFSKYFNHRYKRSGSLFQGKFQAVHVDSNEYLLRVSVYINLNDRVHQLGRKASKLVTTSWKEYQFPKSAHERLCHPDILLGQFRKPAEYQYFAVEALEDIIANKDLSRELEEDHLDALRPS